MRASKLPVCAQRLKFWPGGSTLFGMNAQNTDQPLWDVALEALLRDSFERTGQPLTLEQLRPLADAHTTRLDDMLDTLCRLVEHAQWRYLAADGEPTAPDRDMCRLLRANHRLNDTQLARLSGRWIPVN